MTHPTTNGMVSTIALILVLQGHLSCAQAEMARPDEAKQLVTDLGRPGTVEYEKAKYLLFLAPDRSRWEESLLRIAQGGTNDTSEKQVVQAVSVLSQYRDEKLLPFYRERLSALVKADRAQEKTAADIYALLEAIGYVGKKMDAPLLESTLRVLLERAGGQSCLVNDESFWPIALACVNLGEYGTPETGPLLNQIRQRICDEIAIEARQQGRSQGMASENFGTVLFSVDYAISRVGGMDSFKTLMHILDASEEYRVRVAAMNLLNSTIDFDKSKAERNQGIFPCRSEWEMKEIPQVHGRILQRMGEGPDKISYNQVVLADGTHPKTMMSSEAIEKEVSAMREHLKASAERWKDVKKHLVPVSPYDVLDLLRKGPVAGHSWKQELTRDKRREMPFTGGYL